MSGTPCVESQFLPTLPQCDRCTFALYPRKLKFICILFLPILCRGMAKLTRIYTCPKLPSSTTFSFYIFYVLGYQTIYFLYNFTFYIRLNILSEILINIIVSSNIYPVYPIYPVIECKIILEYYLFIF